jgi:hypothetical protein
VRKHLVRIALFAVLSTVFIGVAGASPASAATNCTMKETSIQWVGYFAWSGYAQNCTVDTNQVEFTGLGTETGIYDSTWGTHIYVNYAPTPHVFTVQNNGTAGNQVYGAPAYCGGQIHAIQTYYNFRLKSGNPPYAWGPWHFHSSLVYYIPC